jgi:signal transduction histidine kinase
MPLQGKVSLILAAVIFPVSLILGLAQSRVMEPVLFEEIRQVGVSFAQNLANQIQAGRLLTRPNTSALIEDRIQRMLYAQPGVVRVDVIARRPADGSLFYLASSVEEPEGAIPADSMWSDRLEARVIDEDDNPVWDIVLPLVDGPNRVMVHLLISLGFVSTIQNTFLKINLIGAILSTVLLILILSYLLRRAIENERQLRAAQESNAMLSGRLQEIQESLIQTEKLAVMGQLTASFAHEIGTPLNAVGGHLQLLKMGLEKLLSGDILGGVLERIAVISGQLRRIEEIVKGFLATTKKPIDRQKMSVPVRDLVRNVLALVQPTLQNSQIQYSEDFRDEGVAVEVVPLEIEQVILNLVNNAIYSLREKHRQSPAGNHLWVRTYLEEGVPSVTIEIQDSGTGISEANQKLIFKPFFTTKPTGEGHGLGLSICQQIIHSYGGEIGVDSAVGEWTRMRVRLPFRTNGGEERS